MLTYSLDAAPAGMTIDEATGLIEWNPTEGQVGDHQVVVRVEDVGGLFDTQEFTLVVRSGAAPVVISCDVDGNERNDFMPGETVYMRGSGYEPGATYLVWIQPDGVQEGYQLVTTHDPSGTQEIVVADAEGIVETTSIWAIPPDAPVTCDEWDIVLDRVDAGQGYYSEIDGDGLDDASAVGLVSPIPELPIIVLVSLGLFGLLGYLCWRRRSCWTVVKSS